MINVRMRILVADDEHDAVLSLTTLLREEGHEVRGVYRGDAVVDAVTEFSPDVVLLDLGMPDFNGYQVARELRSRYSDARPHLIFEGTLDRFPGLKSCAAHGGGYLPSYAARSDAVQTTFPNRMIGTLKKRPTEYLRQLYFDSIVFTPEALRHLAAEAGPNQIVMGTDYPFPWTKTSVDHILGTPGLSDVDKVAMLGGTAAALLGIRG